MPPETLTDVLDDLAKQAGNHEAIALDDVLGLFEGRAFGPLLVVPGLLALTPLGAIPGVPTALAGFIVLVSAQRLAGRKHPWLPRWLGQRSVSSDTLDSAVEKARPWTRRVDRLLKPRLRVLVDGPMQHMLGAVGVLVALTMPPLELVPFAVIVPGACILALGLGMIGRDGLMALLALLFGAGALGLILWALWLR